MVSSPSTSPPTSPLSLPRDMAPPDRPRVPGSAVDRLADALPVVERALPGRMPRGADGKVLPSAITPSARFGRAQLEHEHEHDRHPANTQGSWVTAGLKTERDMDALVAALEIHDREEVEQNMRRIHHIIGSATAGRGPQEIAITRGSGVRIATAYRRSGPPRTENPDKLVVTLHPVEAESSGVLTIEAAEAAQTTEGVGLGLGLQLGQKEGDGVAAAVAKKKKKNKKKKKGKKGRGATSGPAEEDAEDEGEDDREEQTVGDGVGPELVISATLEAAEEGHVGVPPLRAADTADGTIDTDIGIQAPHTVEEAKLGQGEKTMRQKEDSSEAKGRRTRPQTPSLIIPPPPFSDSPVSPINFLVSPLSPEDESPTDPADITVRMPSSATKYPKVSLEGMTFGTISATESPAHSPPSKAKARQEQERPTVFDQTRPSTPQTEESLAEDGTALSSIPRIEVHTPDKDDTSSDPTEVDPSSPTPLAKVLDVSIVNRPDTPATFEIDQQSMTNGDGAEPSPTGARETPGTPPDVESGLAKVDVDTPLTPTAETPLAPAITPVMLDSQPSPMVARHDSRSPLGSPRIAPCDGFPFPPVAISAEVLATPHPLARSWILHTDVPFKDIGPESGPATSSARQRSSGKILSAATYSSSYSPVFKANEVGDLCGKWKALRRAIAGLTMRAIDAEGEMVRDHSELGLGVHTMKQEGGFQFFEEGVEPMWEDPACARGGKVTLTGDAKKIDAAFLGTVLMLVSGELHDECAVGSANAPNAPEGIKDIRVVGAVLRRKSSHMRLELWLGGSRQLAPPDEWIKRLSNYVAAQLGGVKVLSYQPFHESGGGSGSGQHGGRGGGGHRTAGGGSGFAAASGPGGSHPGSRSHTPAPGEMGRGHGAPMAPIPHPPHPHPPHASASGVPARADGLPRTDTLGRSASFAGLPPPPPAGMGMGTGLAPPRANGPQACRPHSPLPTPPMGVPMARGMTDMPIASRPPAGPGFPPMGQGLGIGPRAQGPYGLGPPREGQDSANSRGGGDARIMRMGTPMRATNSAGV